MSVDRAAVKVVVHKLSENGPLRIHEVVVAGTSIKFRRATFDFDADETVAAVTLTFLPSDFEVETVEAA